MIDVSEHDTNLLLAVDWDISGGQGGASGMHGRPGEGGQGGEGGVGCTWCVQAIPSRTNPGINFSVLGKCTTVLDMRVVEAGEFALVRRYVKALCRDLLPFFS